jgi:hypothetical protein
MCIYSLNRQISALVRGKAAQSDKGIRGSMFSIEKDKDGDDHHHRDAGTHAVITPYLDLVEHPERPLPKRCTNCSGKVNAQHLAPFAARP